MSYCLNRPKKCICYKEKKNNNIDVRCPQYTLACKSINSAMKLSAGKNEKLFNFKTFTKNEYILPPKLNKKTLYEDKCANKCNCKYPKKYKISKDMNLESTAQNGGPVYNYSVKQGLHISNLSEDSKYSLIDPNETFRKKENTCYDENCCS